MIHCRRAENVQAVSKAFRHGGSASMPTVAACGGRFCRDDSRREFGCVGTIGKTPGSVAVAVMKSPAATGTIGVKVYENDPVPLVTEPRKFAPSPFPEGSAASLE